MTLAIEERLSDSPLVERIWRSQSEGAGPLRSIALSHWELVVWTQHGKTQLSLRGPETRATLAEVPAETEFFGIIFKPGTLIEHLPVKQLVDSAIMLPSATGQSFWLQGAAWQIPNFENADVFVDRLVRQGLLVREPVVDAALSGHATELSIRSVQRRILRATGLTYGRIQQIERARHAAILLREGLSILDTVYKLGYADQPHLTRSLKRLIGQTPAQLQDTRNNEQLSFLFKTHAPAYDMLALYDEQDDKEQSHEKDRQRHIHFAGWGG